MTRGHLSKLLNNRKARTGLYWIVRAYIYWLCLPDVSKRKQHFLLEPLKEYSPMQPAEDPTPEFVHIFGDCFLVSTTTNSSIQEAKNSVTSCLTVSRAHTSDSVETAVMVLYSVLLKIGKERRCTDVRGSGVLIVDGLTVRCLLLTVN